MQMQDLSAVSIVESAAAGFPWPKSQFADSLAAGHDCTVLQDGRAILGFMIFSRVLDEANLLNIAVHPNAQGKGYGRQLLEAGLAQQAEQGASQCFLEVRVSNNGALSLYQSMGFVTVGERKNYYPARQGRENAWVMRRTLSGEAQPIATV